MHYIFEVVAKADYSIEQYAEAWLAASKLIQQADGACGTRLHRCLNNPKRALAIASWTSKAHRDAMDASMSDEIRDIISEQSRYVDVRLIGEFATADWEALPSGLLKEG